MSYSVKSSSGERKGTSGGRLDPHKGMTSTQNKTKQTTNTFNMNEDQSSTQWRDPDPKGYMLMTPFIQNPGKVKTIVTERSSTVAKFWGLGKEADSKRQGTRESGGWAFLYLDCHDASLCTCQNWLNHLSYTWHPNKFDHLEKVSGRPHTRL